MDQATTNSAYFMRRASEERAAALRAQDPRARQSHSDLAERYLQAVQTGVLERDEDAPAHIAAVPLLQPEFRILP
jgi:hypothetical protein